MLNKMKRDPEASAIRSIILNMKKVSQEKIYNLIEAKLPPSYLQLGAVTLYIQVGNYDRRIHLTDLWSAVFDRDILYLFTNDGILYAFDTRHNAKLTIWVSANRSSAPVRFLRELCAGIGYVWQFHKKDLLPTSIVQRHRMQKEGNYPEVKRY